MSKKLYRCIEDTVSDPRKLACCAADRPTTLAGRQPPASKPRAKAKTRRARKKTASTSGMVRLDSGAFLMGTDDNLGFPDDGEGPVREVYLHPFYIDPCAVTNARFARFVKATGYQTEAERFGWSFVFHSFIAPSVAQRVTQVASDTPWWWPVENASWRCPEGPGSTVRRRLDHPAVHISWNDAAAYCKWAGMRLPTEAEWEFAARGGLKGKTYPWGDELTPNGEHRCNIWQGTFPDVNTAEDGHVGTAPAHAFPPNGYGLYSVSGNVWEWCADWFSPDFHVNSPHENPKGPPSGGAKVMRGGSYLCHDSYCNRYRVGARSSITPDSSTGNLGFRCARNA